MRLIKHLALGAMLTISAFCAVLYTSCSKDACKDVTCSNGGTCSGGNCTCPVGYEGTSCQTLSRDKFIGTYTGTEICTVGTDNYTITLAANSNDLQLTYSNLYNQAFTATCTIVSPDSFSFSGTQSGATFSGTGTLSTNTLTVNYTIVSSSASNSCVFTGSK